MMDCEIGDAVQRLASGDKAPECDEQFARECDDHRFARAGTAIGSAGLVPSRQRAVLLKPQKAPGEWDHPAADPGIAGFDEPCSRRLAPLSSGAPVRPA